MANILRQLALLFAGALASVIGASLFLALHPNRCPEVYIISGSAMFLLILYGSGAITGIRNSFHLWRRRTPLLSPKVGILSDMRWEQDNDQISSGTQVSPEDWERESQKWARSERGKIKIELIDAKKSFTPYVAVINPYGGVYPEHNLKNFETMNKILNYVKEGGLFVSVADTPCYWAHNPLLKRRLDSTPPIYGIDKRANGSIGLIPVRPFELTPLMKELGLQVINTEGNPVYNWDNPQVADRFKEAVPEIGQTTINVHRAVIVERNVEPIIEPRMYGQMRLTPFFLVNYGDGKFLISLIFLRVSHPQNLIMKEVLAKLITKLAKERGPCMET